MKIEETRQETRILELMHTFIDITAPEHGVQIEVRADGQVIWVHVDGKTVLRICRIKQLEVIDARPKEQIHRGTRS